jgi:hypothetical protein
LESGISDGDPGKGRKSLLPRYSRERARTMATSIVVESMHSIGIGIPVLRLSTATRAEAIDLLAILLPGEEEQCILFSFRMITTV